MIEINYQDTINKAEQLEDLAFDIKHICQSDIAGITDSCNAVWKGDASSDFQKKLGKLQSQIEKRSKNLESTAGALGKSARRLKQAEEYAKLLFAKK